MPRRGKRAARRPGSGTRRRRRRTARRPRLNPPTIDRSLTLSPDQFLQTATPKGLIVLHHTVGGSAASTVRWWARDPRRIATAYVIGRDGTVHEVFPARFWAWHLGVKDREMERRSIGIELASEGALTERDGVLYAFDGHRELGDPQDLLAAGRVVHLPEGYRGYHWFDAYDEAQVASTIKLVRYLCDRFGIRRRVPREAAGADADLPRWHGYRGVLHHAMLRDDKSDLHPRFPFARLAYALGDASWREATG